MNKIIFILAMLFCPSLYAATLTPNTVPYVCQGGASPQLCNSNITTDSNGNLKAGFGAWTSEAANTIYQAQTDGFVIAISTNYNQPVVFSILSDSNPNPSTVRFAFGQNNFNQNYVAATGMIPVRSGDYWQVQYNNSEGGSQSLTVYWISTKA